MESGDAEQQYRGDRSVKRGLFYARKDSHPAGSRVWRSLAPVAMDEHCTPRRYILAIFCVLTAFALAGCFLFSNSIDSNPQLQEDTFDSPVSNAKTNRLPLHTLGQKNVDTEAESYLSETKPALGIRSSPLGCSEKAAMLKVYMYDLPTEFHYGILETLPYPEGQIWPQNISAMPPYPGGLYQQHSPEYWLTSDLLTSTFPDRESVCTAYRVEDWRFADVIFIPFFASLSYNRYTRAEMKVIAGRDRNKELQEKLVVFLKQQPAWQASGGFDHVLVIHHPNSMHAVRDQLGSVMFVVADFGRYSPEYANIGKDIVAPYKHVVTPLPTVLTSKSFESRNTLLFFQGAIYRKEGGVIRRQLYELLKDEAGVHFEAGNTTSAAIHSSAEGMQNAKFCLNLAGDTPSSNRLFDAIASHCVPVIISDELELPFEDVLDYSGFCLFVRSDDALKRGFVINLLRGVSSQEWTQMWTRLREVDRHFKYQHPTKPDDAVHMTWKAIARKVSKVRLFLNKQRRYELSKREMKLKQSFRKWIPLVSSP